MYSNNSNYSFIVSASCTFICTVLIILGSVLLYETSKEVKDLNKDIGVLNLHDSNYKSAIESMQKQIVSYKLENDELKDKILTYNKEIQKLRNSSIEENVDSDISLLAQLIESESGNQSFEGKLAVGTVVMNRVESDEFPDTIREVIFQKGQFSVVPNGTINNKPSDESLRAAKKIMSGSRVLASNVLYFYNPKFTSKSNWIRSLKVTKRIEDHVFAV